MNEIKKKNAPVVVGLDPNLSMIPDHIMNKAIKEYGETLEAGDTTNGRRWLADKAAYVTK